MTPASQHRLEYLFELGVIQKKTLECKTVDQEMFEKKSRGEKSWETVTLNSEYIGEFDNY